MLQIVRRLEELDFSAIMDIYIEGNLEKAEEYGDGGLLRAEREFYDYLREDFFRQRDAFYAVWKVGGRYVSALRLEPYGDGWLLEALETAPAHRKQGYAKALVRAVLDCVARPAFATSRPELRALPRFVVLRSFVLRAFVVRLDSRPRFAFARVAFDVRLFAVFAVARASVVMFFFGYVIDSGYNVSWRCIRLRTAENRGQQSRQHSYKK